MKRFFDFALRDVKGSTSLTQLRQELLKEMLLISFLIGTVLFIFALIPAIQRGLYLTILIYVVLYIWIILITLLRRVSYRIRSITWLVFFYVLGVINLFLSGFNVDAGLFLLTLVAMASLMGGARGGLIALVASSIAIAALGFIHISGNVKLGLGLPQTNPLLWIIGGTIFILMGFLLAASLSVVIRGLEMNLAKANALTTELKWVNEALRQSEDRYRTLVETSPDLILLLDTDGKILVINKVGLAMFHYNSMEEVIGKDMLTFIIGEDQPRMEQAFQKILETGGIKDAECRALRSDDSTFSAEFSASLIVDRKGKPQAVIALGKDISLRKQAEQLLRTEKDNLADQVVETTFQLQQAADLLANQSQLRRLTNQIITAQEEERRRISRELHDDAGQALISLKYSLASIVNEIPESHAVMKKRLIDSMGIVDQTMKQIRTMAHSLRPPALDIGGINLGLQDCCQEFMERTCFRVDYRGEDIPALSPEISISLYRFVQEALTNTLKHAQATEAKVRLKYRKGRIHLSVSDNGRGIHDAAHSDGIGLLGIQERLDLLGGHLQVSSPRGRGMKLVASVPWQGVEEKLAP